MRTLLLIPLLAACEGGAANDPITLDFHGRAATVIGLPFGVNADDATIEGSMTYNKAGLDTEAEDTARGVYHYAGTEFSLRIRGREITGSGNGTIEVETGGTFRFVDGPDEFTDGLEDRYMEVDGEPVPTAELWFSIVGPGFEDDLPPDPFELTPDLPHTFDLHDSRGQMLLQLDALTQR